MSIYLIWNKKTISPNESLIKLYISFFCSWYSVQFFKIVIFLCVVHWSTQGAPSYYKQLSTTEYYKQLRNKSRNGLWLRKFSANSVNYKIPVSKPAIKISWKFNLKIISIASYVEVFRACHHIIHLNDEPKEARTSTIIIKKKTQ